MLKHFHYTIVDLFDSETCLKTGEGKVLKKYFPNVISLEIIRSANVKPPKSVPLPIKQLYDNSNNNMYMVKSDMINIPMLTWISKPFKSSYNLIDQDESMIFEKRLVIEILYLYVDVKITFNDITCVQKEYNHFEIVEEIINDEDNTDEVLLSKNNVDLLDFLNLGWLTPIQKIAPQLIYGVRYYPGKVYSNKPEAIYLDPYQKNDVDFSGYKISNYHDPDQVKYVYADFSNYFENYRIYKRVFEKLLELGKSIEDLNYATKLIIRNPYKDSKYDSFHEVYDTDNVEITFGKEKLRDLTFEDYRTNVIMYCFCVDLDKYKPSSLFKDKDYWENRDDKVQILWCGIPFGDDGFVILGNFCTCITFDPKTRTFQMDGECG